MLRPSAGETLRAWLLSALVVHGAVAGNPDAKRLYDDLLSNYNKLVRPVVNTSDVLRVCIKLKLSQLIDVLPSNGLSSGFSEKCDMGAKGGRDMSLLSAELQPELDKTELKDGVCLRFVPYGGNSVLEDSVGPTNLEENFVKEPAIERKKKHKSKVTSNYSEADAARRKNSRGPAALKPGRKSCKVNRSESFLNNIKYQDSIDEYKRLEKCRIINEEDLDKSLEARNAGPVYFLIKLAEDSDNDFLRLGKCHSNQGFRMIFAKDEVENLGEQVPKSSVSSTSIKMKDKFNQTNDVEDKCTGVSSSEIANHILEDGENLPRSETCSSCLKMDTYLRFQREFNASLLVQMENMLGQLTTLIKLLRDLLMYKNDTRKEVFKELILQKFLKMRESGDGFGTEVGGSPEDVLVLDYPKQGNSKSVHMARHPTRNPKATPRKNNNGGKIKNAPELIEKKEINGPDKELMEKKENANKRPAEGGDEKITQKNFNEREDADYDDSVDETRSCYDKVEIEIEDDAELTREMTLRKNRFQLIIDEGNPESRRSDVLLCSNEDKAVKLPFPASSRMNLKNQIMTTNLWVEQSWYDYKLRWDPKEYGGVHMLHVPSDHIWRPDIVLYNNADGNYEVTLMTKARVSHTGLVEWQPPAVYKSSCAIDVEFFPYDIQTCVLKLGSWTYDGFKVDLRHMDEKAGSNVVEVGVDLSEFYMSVEWDILEVPAVRNEKFYTCCDEPYLDITFNITMRRKTLFYTVNIIIPCMGISFLTVLTFYLPSDSGEKVTLSISILISLHVFFLLVVEIIPPTSLVVPLLGKYLIFAMILVSISICVTVVVLNVHFRSPQTHRMAPWVKRVFIHILPRLLVMRRPQYHFEPHRFMSRRVIMQTVKGKEIQTSYYPYPYQPSAPADNPKVRDLDSIITRQRTLSKEDFSPESLADGEPVFGGSCQIHGPPPQSESEELSLSGVEGTINNGEDLKSPTIKNPAFSHSMCPPEVHKSCFCVRFIAEHTKMLEDSTKVKEDWKYVAMVLDRLFLWIFTLAVLVGTAGIILQAPTLYDDRIPIDKQFAEIQTSTVIRCPPQ